MLGIAQSNFSASAQACLINFEFVIKLPFSFNVKFLVKFVVKYSQKWIEEFPRQIYHRVYSAIGKPSGGRNATIELSKSGKRQRDAVFILVPRQILSKTVKRFPGIKKIAMGEEENEPSEPVGSAILSNREFSRIQEYQLGQLQKKLELIEKLFAW